MRPTRTPRRVAVDAKRDFARPLFAPSAFPADWPRYVVVCALLGFCGARGAGGRAPRLAASGPVSLALSLFSRPARQGRALGCLGRVLDSPGARREAFRSWSFPRRKTACFWAAALAGVRGFAPPPASALCYCNLDGITLYSINYI